MFLYVLRCMNKAILGLWYFMRCCQQYRPSGPSPAYSALLSLHGGDRSHPPGGESLHEYIGRGWGSHDDRFPWRPRPGRLPRSRPQSRPPPRRSQGQTVSREAAPRPVCVRQRVQDAPSRPPQHWSVQAGHSPGGPVVLGAPRRARTARGPDPVSPRSEDNCGWDQEGSQPAAASAHRPIKVRGPASVMSISSGRRYFPTMFVGPYVRHDTWGEEGPSQDRDKETPGSGEPAQKQVREAIMESKETAPKKKKKYTPSIDINLRRADVRKITTRRQTMEDIFGKHSKVIKGL
ncbi:hypothetical protein NDU88_004656 [Pleurodeles waltl]|uniref:Uncharacterized protein n=1 Tax=Pleurodeles waltl TaxID=8319 RepID=A0AAV7UHP4_PLEWA|nr:hypothetical protein NDU88_004656 [Pleurodeles waltl]